jgi:hypothetical protein
VRLPHVEVTKLIERRAVVAYVAFSDRTQARVEMPEPLTPLAVQSALREAVRDGTARGEKRWRELLAMLPSVLRGLAGE